MLQSGQVLARSINYGPFLIIQRAHIALASAVSHSRRTDLGARSCFQRRRTSCTTSARSDPTVDEPVEWSDRSEVGPVTESERLDVIVVGAGAAGVGVGVALSHLDVDVRVVERDQIGASFRAWPEETSFITPSFPSNGFGLPDLNAIAPGTSPAVATDREHPSGPEYAEYLEALAAEHELSVDEQTAVSDVTVREREVAVSGASDASTDADSIAGDDVDATDSTESVAVDGGASAVPRDRFTVETTGSTYEAPFLVWAGGQFGAPRTDVFPGAEHCRHSSTVDAWADHLAASSTGEFLIVGGFESGVGAALSLVEYGASVTVLDRDYPWAVRYPDPSESLAPVTMERLDDLDHDGRLRFVGGVDVERVERADDGRFEVVARNVEAGDRLPAALQEDPGDESGPTSASESDAVGDETGAVSGTGDDVRDEDTPDDDVLGDVVGDERRFTVSTPPILATGYDTDLGPVADLFPREDGRIDLTDRDESPDVPGLFLAGPAVEHRGGTFCFIYKFRTRFPVVAETIGERLGVDVEPLDVYRSSDMFLEDLECCEPDWCDC